MASESRQYPLHFTASPESSGMRLDQFLVGQLGDIGRTRVQELIAGAKVTVDGRVGKSSLKLKGVELITVLEPVDRKPLRAFAEDIALEILFEDDCLAVINKPAGMMVHAGAGVTDSDRNRGTLVNALLHRFNQTGSAGLSQVGGELRPGIVHRLDRETSGVILVAKTDSAHRKLAAQFAKYSPRCTPQHLE